MTFNRFKCILTLTVAAALLCSCGMKEIAVQPMAEATPVGAKEETPASPVPAGEGKAVITEVMSKNAATLMAEDGTFPDWIEIRNVSDETLVIDGWKLGDSPDSPEMTLSGSLEPGEYAVYFTSGFKLSEGETACLFDSGDNLVDSLEITSEKADVSLTKDGPCKYPTPGRENTKSAFAALQEERTASGPLVISEVAVENFKYYYTTDDIEYTDWVEVKNISSSTIVLSDYYMSDDGKDLFKYNFPGITLQPGGTAVFLCDKKAPQYKGEYYMAPFSLDSENDRLFISDREGVILDYTPLRDIPYGKTYGRVDGENGFFYLSQPSPGESNGGGKRYVADTPVAENPDGVYNNVDSVTVELRGEGDIYYTLDTSIPTSDSTLYTGPITLNSTTVVRAVSVLPDAADSRPLTLNYIINENHTIPVVCVVSDEKAAFDFYYGNGYRTNEMPGVLSYYGEDGTFTIGAGMKLHGDTSLLLAKKNLSFRFRGCYGAEELNFDLFGGGVTTFTNLLLRSGQEQNNTIVRGEACTNLLAEYSDSVVYQRSKYVIMYVNGQYHGIYSLKEKLNEQMYASNCGVSKGSVVMNEATVYMDQEFYREVIDPIYSGDMRDDAQFAEATKHLDIQSIIDWTLLEGWVGNYDLAEGNLRYVKSDDYDGLWRLCLYDLDCAFADTSYTVDVVFNYPNQISRINSALMVNAGYRDMYLRRAGEVYTTVLTDEKMVDELEKQAAIIQPEVERDKEVSGLGYEAFRNHMDLLESRITGLQWSQGVIDKLCRQLNVTDAEREMYFHR